MAPKLMLEGFVVRPVIYEVDMETSTVAAAPRGEQLVKLADLAAFPTEVWPDLWAEIIKQYEAQQMHNNALALVEAEATGNRATKRAAKKAAVKHPSAAKLASQPADPAAPGVVPKKSLRRMVPPVPSQPPAISAS